MTKPRVRIDTHGRLLSMGDGLTNFVSNIGQANAKTSATTYLQGFDSQASLEATYSASTWFGKIVDIPADDATREWRSWKADSTAIEDLEAAEKDLNVRVQVNKALKWARLYGGAVIIPDLPGNPTTPLNIERVTKDSVRFLSVLHRFEIQPDGDVRRNPLDPLYGLPERWRVNAGGGDSLFFHPSRVFMFNGRRASNGITSNTVWGESIWRHLSDAIEASDSGANIIHALLHEAKIDVVRVDGFMDFIGTDEGESAYMRRWDLAAKLKSVANMLVLDGQDEYEQKTMNWSGLPDVMDTLLTVMSGAADIPVTRLVGKSPGGLNSTGESDLRNYYDSVKAKQDLQLSPQMAPLDEVLIRTALGDRPKDIWYDWKPLWTPDEKERAETQKVRAETFQIELNSGAFDEEMLVKTYLAGAIESGLYPGLEQARADAPDEGFSGEEDPSAIVPVTADALPRTLYVRRDVVNKTEITKWAEAQGFTDIVPDLHITIMYSRSPVDWMKMGSAWESTVTIPAGGPRVMEAFGEAKVLLISANDLQWRHRHMREMGASYDFEEYQPHVTISYGDMPENVEPYQGEIVLGPEIFEEAKQ